MQDSTGFPVPSFARSYERTFRVITVVMAFLVILSMLHLYSLLNPLHAAALSSITDTVSTSAPSVVADHVITFTMDATNTLANDDADSFIVFFDSATYGYNSQTPDGFDLSTLTLTDIDIEDDGVDKTIAADCTGAEDMGVVVTSGTPDQIVFTNCTENAVFAASSVVTIQLGSVAAGGTTRITNPATVDVSYPVTIHVDPDGVAGTPDDQGETRIMILDTVTMQAMVGTNLDCVILGLADGGGTGGTVNGLTLDSDSPGGPANIGTATDVLLDFDWIVPNDATSSPGIPADAESLGQSLAVTTNAANGFIWTIEQDQNMTSGIGSDIDLYVDGGAQATPNDYASPTIVLADENTWGHYGFTSEDGDLQVDTGGGDPDDFDDDANASCTGAPCIAGNLAAARTIFAATQPADGTTADIGFTEWAVLAELTSLQEAGTYVNTLTHICTPTF